MKDKHSNIIGVDIGGTKVAAGVVNPAGEVLFATRARMVTNKSAEHCLAPVLLAIEKLLADRRAGTVSGIGISAPGWVDSRQGIILGATNLPCWKDYPLAEKIQKHYRLPTRLANDANAAALGEAVWGAGAGYKNVFYVSMGTGIGTGIIFEKRLYYGRTGMAGEGGHMSIDFSGPFCACGKRGCIEMYASGTAIGLRARQRLGEAKWRKSKMLELVEGKIASVTAHTVGEAALDGDPLANEVLREAAESLAIWLGNIIDLLEPEVIVLGGGLGHLMTSFLSVIRDRLDIWAINPRSRQIPIVNALYQAESGIVGSAALCLPRTQVWLSAWQKPSARDATAMPKRVR